MDYDTLERLRRNHTAWRLLIADHLPLILSFLALIFLQPNRRAIATPVLTAQLGAYLEQLAETHGLERYPKAARRHLEDWATPERAYLRKFEQERIGYAQLQEAVLST